MRELRASARMDRRPAAARRKRYSTSSNRSASVAESACAQGSGLTRATHPWRRPHAACLDDELRGQSRAATYRALRSFVGRTILLSLEILVAADLIRTVAVDPSLENVGSLALIVLIRTILSFSLDVEIEGRLPWRSKVADATE